MTVFLVLLLLLVVGIGVVIVVRLDAVRREQQARTARLTQTWRAMQAVGRINAAHWRARQMMRSEAERHRDEDFYSS